MQPEQGATVKQQLQSFEDAFHKLHGGTASPGRDQSALPPENSGFKRSRFGGAERLANLAYNFDRLIFHERRAATG